MLAALQTLHDLPCSGRRIAVLGDMAELGEQAAPAHEEVGQHAAQLGLQRLITVGEEARKTAEAARAGGMRDVSEFADVESVVRSLEDGVKPGDLVLVKASRAAGLERIVAALRGQS
jgi:UDP-N-acetylmuramoyl-tripeptide--D-alanyl-D-alanine ligase